MQVIVLNPQANASAPARPAIARTARSIAVARKRSRTDFAFSLLIAVNAIVFIRPAELIPALAGWPIYEVLIIACALTCLPQVIEQATRHLRDQPMNVCVLGLLVAVVMSHLSHQFIWGARHSGWAFSKLVIFYLLVVALVTNTARLKRLLSWLWLFIVIMTTLSLLQYHGAIDIPSLAAYQDRADAVDEVTGEPAVLKRLCGAGIFNDPNDFCLILLFGTMLSLYRFNESKRVQTRITSALSAGMFLWALYLTHSRGGFLALLASMAALTLARFGWKRALPLALLAAPVLFYLFAGRQTDISTTATTGMSRIRLWSEGLQFFRGAPLFGIGMDQFAEEVNLVTHNSFLQSFAELGMFGGALFLGAFWISFVSLRRVGANISPVADSSLRILRPYLLATLVAYGVGYLTLSRAYSVPTYFLLATIVCYVRLAAPPGIGMPRLSTKLVGQVLALSVLFIGCMYVFVRTFVRWG